MRLWNRHSVPENIEATYIGRGTIWGNPFIMDENNTRDQVSQKYHDALARALAGRQKKAIDCVRGLMDVEHIACSCTPHRCHGDTYVELFKHIADNQNNMMRGIRSWLTPQGFPGPETDGIDHINVYSKAKTKLGKKLTNLSNLPVYIEGIGQFMSLEGYWYYLSLETKYPELLDMDGFQAKMFGKDKPRKPTNDFKDKIRVALWKRFEQNPTIKDLLIKSTLPFKHYYHYGDDDLTVCYPPFDWVTEELELLRKLYQGKLQACIIAGSRDIEDIELVNKAVKDSGFEFDIVVSGKAKGVDTLGEQWASSNGKLVRGFHADWDLLGKKAGILRNKDMGNFCTKGIVIIKNNSRGSTQMAEYLKSLNKDVYAVHV